MTAHRLPGTFPDETATLQLLEGLGRFHQLVVVTDASGRILWLRDALGLIHGKASDYVGQDINRVLADYPAENPSAEIRDRVRRAGYVSDFRVEMKGKRGANVALDVSVFPVNVAGSDEPVYVAIARPVTERDQLERKWRGSADYFRAIMDSTPDAVVVVDHRGFVTYANPAIERCTGYAPADLVDKPIGLFLLHAVDLERITASMRSIGEIHDRIVEIRRSDGATRVVSVSVSLLRLPDGRSEGTVALLRDVTDRRQAEASLERKTAELEHWVHTVSHDLRSPLVALLGFSRLLRQDYFDQIDNTGKHFLDRIEQAARTMESLVHNLVELSRIGTPRERPSMVDPRAVLLQIQAELKPRLEAQGVALRLPDCPPTVLCDRTRLYQIFSNLIGNALDHMGSHATPCVEAEIQKNGDGTMITVRDNGKGIDPRHHERIFEIFHTIERPRDGRSSTGIGLAIVKKIAETRGGRAWVESAPGEGTAVHVLLPDS